MAEPLKIKNEEFPLKEKFQQAQLAASCAAEDLGTIGKAAKETAQDTYQHVQKNVEEYVQKGQEKFKKVEKQVEDQIQKYPFRALVIAGCVGFLLGFLKRK